MAKVIRPILENRIDIGFIPDLDKPIAEEIYNAGYRKIPVGAVVLRRGEYDEFLRQGAMIDFLKDCIQQARKETARELATRIKAKVDETSSCGLVEEYVTVFNKHINDIVNEYVEDVTNG
jgi:hypothetical protein